MPLKFQCQCGTKLVVSRHYAGRRVKCPKCSERIEVPSLEEESLTEGNRVPSVAPRASTIASRSAGKSRSKSPSRRKPPSPPPRAKKLAPTSSTVKVKPLRLPAKSPEAFSPDVVEAEPPPVQRQTEPEPPTQPAPTPPPVDGQALRDRDALKGGDPPVVKPSLLVGRSNKTDPHPVDKKMKSPIAISLALEVCQEAKQPAAVKPRAEKNPPATVRPPSRPLLPTSKPAESSSPTVRKSTPRDLKDQRSIAQLPKTQPSKGETQPSQTPPSASEPAKTEEPGPEPPKSDDSSATAVRNGGTKPATRPSKPPPAADASHASVGPP